MQSNKNKNVKRQVYTQVTKRTCNVGTRTSRETDARKVQKHAFDSREQMPTVIKTMKD